VDGSGEIKINNQMESHLVAVFDIPIRISALSRAHGPIAAEPSSPVRMR
jgi:hypothetical protein